ncbi:MAG TPA: hypothetical protein VE027_02575 [Acidimicrobiia bacterium]|jgi:hypothetical protein|nr:hypothetical protein [Acidimicrobiia bacterium]
MSSGHRRGRRILLATLVLAALVPLGPSPAAAVSTECDDLADTEIPADARIGDFGPGRFLADVDGDQHRDVVTGYVIGGPPPAYGNQDAYLHVELASGWGTVIQLDQFTTFPISQPVRVADLGGRRLIVIAFGVGANLAEFAFLEFSNCSLAPVELVTGGLPRIIAGGSLLYSSWFACRSNDVVMLKLERGFDEDGNVVEEIMTGGDATVYRLEPGGFRRTGRLDLNLPRLHDDLRREFPDCSRFGGTFVDDDESVFQGAIEWLALEGLTKGCNPPAGDRYCPERGVTRSEMAALVVRALGLTEDGGGDLFTDDDGSVFEVAIDRLGAAGLTRGCNPPANDRFCPERGVTRGEMAAFLVRALGLTDDGGGDLFTDDDGSVFQGAIDRLGAAGITAGCNPPVNDRFCPDEHVTRGQMAAFLIRAFGGKSA